MSKPTLSRLPLFLECQASIPDPTPVGQSAKFGNALGLLAERYCYGETCDVAQAALDEGCTDVARLERVWLATVAWLQACAPYEAEVAFALDVEAKRARILGRRIRRAYEQHGAQKHEVCGSADLVRLEPDIVCVRDLKSGRGPWDKYIQQVNGYALAACLATGARRADCGVVMCTESDPDVYLWELDAIDLDALWHNLRAKYRAAPVPRAGGWCEIHYCGARRTCSALASILGELAP